MLTAVKIEQTSCRGYLLPLHKYISCFLHEGEVSYLHANFEDQLSEHCYTIYERLVA
jgi:hypothetical protein